MTNKRFHTDNTKIRMTIQRFSNGEETYRYIDCPPQIIADGDVVWERLDTGRRDHHGSVLPNVWYRVYAYQGVYFKVKRTHSAESAGYWSAWSLLWIAPMSERELSIINGTEDAYNADTN